MATQYKFYLKKDYDQFRNRIIATNSIAFKICDYTLAEDEQMFMELKEINDVDEDKVYIQMRKKDDNIYVADLLCNKLETYQFRIFTKMPNSDIILEQSAINIFKYEGVIFNEEAIENTAQWGVIQTTLHRLEDLDVMINEYIENSDFAKEVDSFISENQNEINNFIAENRTKISNKIDEMQSNVDRMREDIDNSISNSQTQINNKIGEMKTQTDNKMTEIQTQMDNFIAENQAQVDDIQADVRTVISQLSTILDEFIDEGDM